MTDPADRTVDPNATIPVPVSETATTDPTGTAAGAGGIASNIPDGAHNTGAPADANDPLTGKDADVVGVDERTKI